MERKMGCDCGVIRLSDYRVQPSGKHKYTNKEQLLSIVHRDANDFSLCKCMPSSHVDCTSKFQDCLFSMLAFPRVITAAIKSLLIQLGVSWLQTRCWAKALPPAEAQVESGQLCLRSSHFIGLALFGVSAMSPRNMDSQLEARLGIRKEGVLFVVLRSFDM